MFTKRNNKEVLKCARNMLMDESGAYYRDKENKMSGGKKRGVFVKHAKYSAALISLLTHAVLIVTAVSFVAVRVTRREDQKFKSMKVERPRHKLKKIQVPVKIKNKKPNLKFRKRVVVKKFKRQVPDFKMPEMSRINERLGNVGDVVSGLGGIGFSMPELDFFGAKARGEKVVFVVHFGPATIDGGGDEGHGTPFSRMTGLTIRNRLEDLVDSLPAYTLFNVICYFADEAWAMEPEMQLATSANKEKVKRWMKPVNPIQGDYYHCFAQKPITVVKATQNYPTRVEDLPFYAPSWIYPYKVPKELEEKYAPEAIGGFMHWGRGVAWAILEQQPDTVFVLTTNYIDGWRVNETKNDKIIIKARSQPRKMAKSLQKMVLDVYGPDKRSWPTINVAVLAKAGKDPDDAHRVLDEQFAPIMKAFNAVGSVIEDIQAFMDVDEKRLYSEYESEYGKKENNG